MNCPEFVGEANLDQAILYYILYGLQPGSLLVACIIGESLDECERRCHPLLLERLKFIREDISNILTDDMMDIGNWNGFGEYGKLGNSVNDLYSYVDHLQCICSQNILHHFDYYELTYFKEFLCSTINPILYKHYYDGTLLYLNHRRTLFEFLKIEARFL